MTVDRHGKMATRRCDRLRSGQCRKYTFGYRVLRALCLVAVNGNRPMISIIGRIPVRLHTAVVKNSINNPNRPLTKKLSSGRAVAPTRMKREYEKIDPTRSPTTTPFQAHGILSPDAPIAKPITTRFSRTHASAVIEYSRMPAVNAPAAQIPPAHNPKKLATIIRFTVPPNTCLLL
jgi:hypothetical protein